MVFGNRTAGNLSGGGPYEQWSERLRAWAHDPQTSLEDLPVLTDDTFAAGAYRRLIEQIMTAQRTYMNAWQDRLLRVFEQSGNTHELAVGLMNLRESLRPRMALVNHPSLPPHMREALQEGFRSDLESLQSQVEDAVKRQSSTASIERHDQLLRTVREVSFVNLLTEARTADMHQQLLAHQAPPPPPVGPPQRKFRRLFGQ